MHHLHCFSQETETKQYPGAGKKKITVVSEESIFQQCSLLFHLLTLVSSHRHLPSEHYAVPEDGEPPFLLFRKKN